MGKSDRLKRAKKYSAQAPIRHPNMRLLLALPLAAVLVLAGLAMMQPQDASQTRVIASLKGSY